MMFPPILVIMDRSVFQATLHITHALGMMYVLVNDMHVKMALVP